MVLSGIVDLRVEGNLIRAELADGTTADLDSQTLVLVNPYDREEARLAMEAWLVATLGGGYADYHVLIEELSPILRARIATELPSLPARRYFIGQNLAGQNLGNVANVYARNCDLRNATVGNLTYVDLVTCNCDGMVFSGSLRSVQARDTTFRAATLPADLPPDVYGLTEEGFRQGFAALPAVTRNKLKNVAQDVIAYAEGIPDGQKHFHSWHNVTRLMVQKYGLPLTREMVQKVCTRWPKLSEHLERVIARLQREGQI